MKRALTGVLLILVVAFIGIQLVPVDRSNPPVSAGITVPPAVQAVLRESCYDCHSNETVWPWYAKVAPVSWLVAHDVEEGREHLNFSEWGTYPAGKQEHKLEEIREEVEKGGMPLANYVSMHKEAALTDDEKAVLVRWTREAQASVAGAAGEPPAGGAEDEGDEDHEGHDH